MAKEPKSKKNPDRAIEDAQMAINEEHAEKQPTDRQSADDQAAELRRVPAHPVKPNAFGSSPEPETVPTGVQGEQVGEQVVYVTDDIAPDGTPYIQPKVTDQDIADPTFDGEARARIEDLQPGEADVAAPDEPVVVATEDGAEIERMKQPGKTVVVEPKVEDLHEGGVVPEGHPDKARV